MRWLGILRQWRPSAASCALVCLAAACGGGDGGTGPGGGFGDDLAGTYQLIGVNNQAVPAVVTSDACSPVQIQDGDMTLGADGRYEMEIDWEDENGQNWSGDHGRYQQTNGALVFSSEAWGDQFNGDVEDGVLSIHWDFCADNHGAEMGLAFSR
jgi:hypothetical protein